MIGVVLWSAIHFLPTLGAGFRDRVIGKMGNGKYRGIFSLIVIASLAMMVLGWRSTPELLVYQLPIWTRPVGLLLMIFAFVLFGAAHHSTAIKRFVRHPQLVSLVVWSASHLLTNGTTRAWVLFGGLGLWALVEMPLINRREGAYEKPIAPGWKTEIKGLAISAAIFIAAFSLHPYFAGVSPIPR
jgi:uncharacterized membrane protein